MTILNMVGGGASGPKVPLDAISVFTVEGGDTEATIKWTDPSDLTVNGVLVTSWSSTKIVRKVGSAPSNSSDGTLVLTETVRNDYSVTGYTDTGLTNGTTYYYAAFAVGDNGLETISSTTPNVIPAQGGWKPGANTIAYYPLNSTYTDTDQSGNNNNGTTIGTLTYSDNYCQFSSGNYISIPTIIPYGANPYTISVWYNASDSSGHQNVVYCQLNSTVDDTASALFVYQGHLYYWSKGNNDWNLSSVSISNDTWYNIVFTYTGTQLKCFVNGVSKGTFNRTISSTAPNVANIGKSPNEICIGKTSNLIIEDKVRTATEISDYYNQTKSLYGIS